MPMRRGMALMWVPRAMRSMPSTRIDPPVGSSRRLQQRSSVLLPEPDGPMMKTSSCGATARSMPRSTSTPLKLLRRPRTSRIGGAALVISWMGSPARRRVRRRVVTGHVGHAVAGEHADRRRAGRGCHAEPLLVHLGDRAVELHAFDRVLDGLAQLAGILAQ